MVQSKLLAEYKKLFHYFGDKKDSEQYRMCETSTLGGCAIFTEQVHGNNVVILEDGENTFIKNTDGMVTDKSIMLGIRTADCLPIFFYDPKNRIIAAIHAGWKGLSKGIIENAAVEMKKLGTNTLDLIVSIGPHIQFCCYNVPKNRLDKFQIANASDRAHLLSANGNWYLDIGKIALLQLKSLGIKDSNIEISNICTSCDTNYWSYRRDGKKADRMINIIGINP